MSLTAPHDPTAALVLEPEAGDMPPDRAASVAVDIRSLARIYTMMGVLRALLAVPLLAVLVAAALQGDWGVAIVLLPLCANWVALSIHQLRTAGRLREFRGGQAARTAATWMILTGVLAGCAFLDIVVGIYAHVVLAKPDVARRLTGARAA